MLSKYLFVPAVLGLAGLLFAPGVTAARGPGGGGHGGGHAGGAHVGGLHAGAVHGGGFNHGEFNHGGFYGGGLYGGGLYGGGLYGGGLYGGRGYGYGYGGYGYYPWGGYWGGGYWPSYSGGYYGNYGDTYVAPSYNYSYYPDYGYTNYPEPYTTNIDPAPQVADNSAGIRVILPDPNARVWFDGNATTQTGTDRRFATPALTAGPHSYRIRATWTQNGQEMSKERTVPVTAGRLSVVDFTRPMSESLPTPTTGK